VQGLVKWFSSEKGYGFITCEHGQDHYFNVRDVKGAELPSNGDSILFDSQSGNKGLRALNVSIIKKASIQNSRHSDDRVNCPGCGKKIVPRIITYRGEPQKSVCPYCASVVKDFSTNMLGFIILAVIIIAVLATVF
jgi:cold shock CspA family protein